MSRAGAAPPSTLSVPPVPPVPRRLAKGAAAANHPHRHVSLLTIQTQPDSLSLTHLSALNFPPSPETESPALDDSPVLPSPVLPTPDSPLSVISSIRSLPPTPTHRVYYLPSPPTHRPRIVISEARSVRTSSTPSLPTLHEDLEYVSFLDLS